MIEILNDLKEYCEDCPYMTLSHSETLGSGKLSYTCKYKRICEHWVLKIKKMTRKVDDESWESEE